MIKALKVTFVGMKTFLGRLHPSKAVTLGYLSYIVIGWVLLCFPIAQKSHGVGSLDNLFTATSALSTTGLATVSISDDYNFLGQVIILTLIELGGIGYMTFGSFVILARKKEFTYPRAQIANAVFSLPKNFVITKFIKSVIAFTVVIELIGAGALYALFVHAGASQPLWSAIFHSVSAFCTAGFSLYNDSFMGFADRFWLNAVIATLSILGAIGFIVCVDFWRLITGRTTHMTLTSKIILWSSGVLLIGGTCLLALFEPTIQNKPADIQLLEAFFQAMAAMTTVGFNTIDIGSLSRASLLVIIFLMVIGASPSGTGGGLKSTTFSALIGVMKSAIRGTRSVQFWGKEVPLERVWTAVAGLGFYVGLLLFGTYLLELTQSFRFEQNLFEAASALGTVGLSTGITASLTDIGKLIIIFLMFTGRIGPLTFSMALSLHREERLTDAEVDLAV